MVVIHLKTSKNKYHWTIQNYMYKIENHEVESSNEQKLLMEFVRLKLDRDDVYVDAAKIEKGIENINKHFPPEKFSWLDWELFIFAFVAGVFFDDGTLVFNEFLILIARGAGKTAFMAVLEWYLISVQGIKNYNVDIVATSEEQARTSFDDVKEILDDNKKKYQNHFKFTEKQIIFKGTKSKLKYKTNNAKTKDGARPGAVFFDEVHAYENEENIKVHSSGFGKRPFARRFYFTTDGNNRGGFLDMLKDESQLILRNERPKRRFFPFICKLDKAEEVDDFKMWEKANPSLPYFSDLRLEMELIYETMQDRPGTRLEFMTKRMNWPLADEVSAVTPWETLEEITNIDWPELKGCTCVGGIDMADTMDFVGVGLLFKKDGKYYWLSHTFINKKALEGRNYRIDIDRGIEEGRITIINEETNRAEHIVNWFMSKAREYRILHIAADLYRFNYLRDAFKDAGFNNLEIGRNGSKTHTEIQPFLHDLYLYRKLIYMKDDFMMRWYTNNTYVKPDEKGNITYEKVEPKLRKTDGFSALLHALQYRDKLIEHVPRINRRLKSITN